MKKDTLAKESGMDRGADKSMDGGKTAHYKKLLETECEEVETELKTFGRKNPEHPSKWEATSDASDVDTADDNLVADSMDTYESNVLILKQLEIRYNEIKAALERIKQGTYGLCEKCGKPIEKERLDANPAASTCEAHLEKESV